MTAPGRPLRDYRILTLGFLEGRNTDIGFKTDPDPSALHPLPLAAAEYRSYPKISPCRTNR